MPLITDQIEKSNEAIHQATEVMTGLIASNERLKGQNTILKTLLDDQLRTFEQQWFNDEDLYTPEQLQNYLMGAKYLERAANRHNHIIRLVTEHLSKLPY